MRAALAGTTPRFPLGESNFTWECVTARAVRNLSQPLRAARSCYLSATARAHRARYALCCSPTLSTSVGRPASRSGGLTVRAVSAGCAVSALSTPPRAGTAEGGTAEAAVPDAVQQRVYSGCAPRGPCWLTSAGGGKRRRVYGLPPPTALCGARAGGRCA